VAEGATFRRGRQSGGNNGKMGVMSIRGHQASHDFAGGKIAVPTGADNTRYATADEAL